MQSSYNSLCTLLASWTLYLDLYFSLATMVGQSSKYIDRMCKDIAILSGPLHCQSATPQYMQFCCKIWPAYQSCDWLFIWTLWCFNNRGVVSGCGHYPLAKTEPWTGEVPSLGVSLCVESAWRFLWPAVEVGERSWDIWGDHRNQLSRSRKKRFTDHRVSEGATITSSRAHEREKITG